MRQAMPNWSGTMLSLQMISRSGKKVDFTCKGGLKSPVLGLPYVFTVIGEAADVWYR